MSKRVLITGASGFIFSNVLMHFLEHTDWNFTCIASWKHKGNPLRITNRPEYQFNKDRVNIVTHDLSGIVPYIGDFDIILHGASESHVDRSIANPVNFIENNVSITLQLLEYARRHEPKVFINFGTDESFGETNHKEWDVLLPSNAYAASKACQEMIAISYYRTFKVPVILTNSNNVVGIGQDKEKFVPTLIDLISRGEEVEIHTSDHKPGKRHYNPVQNVSDALLFILSLDNTIDKVRPKRFNLPGGTELDNLEMAQLVAKLLKKPLRYRLVDAESVRPGYDKFYPASEGELSRLGWKPKYKLEECLEEVVLNAQKL